MQLRILDQNLAMRDLAAIEDTEQSYPGENMYTKDDIMATLRSRFYQCYGVYDRDQLAGYCFMAQNFYQNHEAYISNIGVCPTYQGKGVGTELLCKAVSHYLAMNKAANNYLARVRLDVELTNHRALNLYQKMGFVVDDFQPMAGVGNQVMSVGKTDFLRNANAYLQDHGYTTYTAPANTMTK